ncbi:MAG: hypothetical protein PHP64_04170 [Actinomycetota bacterium]|nr:hypothetical protein [Actinomycetota bacterium]
MKKGYDAEQVMEAVNRAISAPDTLLSQFWKETKSEAPNLSFLYPPHSRSLQVNVDLVSRNWEIEADFPIGSRRKFVGSIVVIVKKAVRALTQWYINPIVHQIRKFNMLVTRAINDVANNIEDLEERVSSLEGEIEKLRQDLNAGKKGEEESKR